MKVRVTNIQRFSLHDGPGIRTTVFLKGCTLQCPWCANPENIIFSKQEYIENGQKKVFGEDISLEELEKELLKDHMYYQRNHGGVTFSGGEPLTQFLKLEPLLKRLKDKKIHLCVETSLFVSKECLEVARKYIDLFFVDIKILDSNLCKDVLHGDLHCYIENVDFLCKMKKEVIFRIPVTREYTLNEISQILLFLEKYRPKKVEVFPIHSLGEHKYQLLGKTMKTFDKVSEEEINMLVKKIKKQGIDVSILKI